MDNVEDQEEKDKSAMVDFEDGIMSEIEGQPDTDDVDNSSDQDKG